MKTLELKHITKLYKSGGVEFLALKDVSFDVEKGEFLAIMGPSGSGKSTLMYTLGGLDTPTSGTYLLDGKDVSKMDEHELAVIRRERIGYVFQSFNLLSRSTVLRNVMLPLVYEGVKKEERERRAREALRAVSMDEKLFTHMSNQLSGGQMQRVAIARALINDPALILADEPTGNLDSKTGEVVMATFQRLHSEGRTIVLITHEREVAEYAERIIHVRDGQIVKEERDHKRHIHPDLYATQ